MCLSKHDGKIEFFFVGPLTTSGVVTWTEGAEMLWIKFRHGTFIPKLPHKNFLDIETVLPDASDKRFWLNGSAWQFPTYENVDTFVDWLVRDETLVNDPLVDAVLQGEPHDYSPRTIRHRFLHATGQTQKHIRQVQRAQRAAALLREGVSILDTVYVLGYYDQPHLTHALKEWVGYTPAQLLQTSKPCHILQDADFAPDTHERVLA
jgi:AraC-like DNA-binding protein